MNEIHVVNNKKNKEVDALKIGYFTLTDNPVEYGDTREDPNQIQNLFKKNDRFMLRFQQTNH